MKTEYGIPNEDGRALREPALVCDQAPSGLDPSGFDPARGRTFDFRHQGWGHAIHSPRVGVRTVRPAWWRMLLGAKTQEFPFLTCMGHSTPTPREGDILLVPMKSGKTGRWRVVETQWIGDPRDMFDVLRADFEGYHCDSDQSGEAGQTAEQAGPEGRERGPCEDTASPNRETPNV